MTEKEIEQLARDKEMKRVMTDAIDEWLDKKFAQFGKWSAYGLLALFVAGVAWMTLTANGWHHKL